MTQAVMSHEAEILARLDSLEEKIAPMAGTAKAIGELREELSPRVNEAVQALIQELADVEADFQLEDLLYLIKKLLRNVKNLSFTLDQLKNLIDFAVTVEPLLKSSVPQMIFYLDALERSGVFRFLNMNINVLQQISSSLTPAEMASLGEGMVRLAGTLKQLSRPEALDFLDRVAELPATVDLSAAKPAGPWHLLLAMGDAEFRKGMGVLLELTRGLATLKTPQSA
ncbi:MAG: DUF1641 domain-containing protein [Desulfosarcinaceae bacterium]|nr:DUF1641 domain-containing protein [Desulfosarcinaceae bacterium]